jgi:hypothetical protein
MSFQTSKKPKVSKERKSEQTFLDDEQKICSKCGMVYSEGVTVDDRVHKRFCRHKTIESSLKPIHFPKYHLQNIVSEYPQDESCIISISPGDKICHPKKFEEVKAMVHSQIGWTGDAETSHKERWYLYVKNIPLSAKGTKRGFCVIGCLVVEKIERAFRLVDEENLQLQTNTPNKTNNEYLATKNDTLSLRQQTTLPLLLAKSSFFFEQQRRYIILHRNSCLAKYHFSFE